jgi:D-glycero-D-manno-heptose 1,7-bisphosphate phosphatase
MIRYAATRLNIDLSRSYLVGDALSDIRAGNAAGVRSHLVLTGRGMAQAGLPEAMRLHPDRVHDDLFAATEAILDHH